MSTITAGITLATGLRVSSDTTGALSFKVNDIGTGGNTAMTISSNGAFSVLSVANGNTAMTVSSNGGFSVGTTADPGAGAGYFTGNITAYYSDKRLKNILNKIPNALDKVNTLSGVVYKNNEVAAEYGYTDQSEQIGVIAQEVEAVLPQIVKPAPFDIGQHVSGHEFSKSGQHYKTVQYEKLVPLLIEAIKELTEKVERLEKNQK